MGSQEKSEKNKAQRSKNGKELVEGLGKRSTQLKKWGSKRTRMWRAAEGAGKGTPQRVWVLLEGHWKTIGGLIMMKVSSRDRGHITFGVTRGFVPWDPGWEMSWANAGMESPEEGTVCCSSFKCSIVDSSLWGKLILFVAKNYSFNCFKSYEITPSWLRKS